MLVKRKKKKTTKRKPPAGLVERNRNVSAQHELRVRSVFAKIIENPTKSLGASMLEVGYSATSALHPTLVTKTDLWNELLDKHLSRESLASTHAGLLKASRLDHMIFPLESLQLTDAHIREMLAEVNCTVRRISHGDQARHVYFFAPDNKARATALELAYKLRGDFATDKAQVAFSLVALAKMRDDEDNAQLAGNSIPRLPRPID